MELEFLPKVANGIWTETEVTQWYVCIAEEVERMGSTAVKYLIQWMSPRPYTLECTQQTPVMVSSIYTDTLLFYSTIIITCLGMSVSIGQGHVHEIREDYCMFGNKRLEEGTAWRHFTAWTVWSARCWKVECWMKLMDGVSESRNQTTSLALPYSNNNIKRKSAEEQGRPWNEATSWICTSTCVVFFYVGV